MLQTVNGKKIAERFERMRRFSTADLNEHGGWILQRMLQVYPHLHPLIVDTLVGPVIVAASAGFNGRWRTYLGVGRIFGRKQ